MGETKYSEMQENKKQIPPINNKRTKNKTYNKAQQVNDERQIKGVFAE